jgi:hypothetical protein
VTNAFKPALKSGDFVIGQSGDLKSRNHEIAKSQNAFSP